MKTGRELDSTDLFADENVGRVGFTTPSSGREAMGRVRMTVWVRVQGVGFRWWTRCRALELGLVGHAANLSDGRVEVVAEGPREACVKLLAALRSGSTPGQVKQVNERFVDARGGLTGFVER